MKRVEDIGNEVIHKYYVWAPLFSLVLPYAQRKLKYF